MRRSRNGAQVLEKAQHLYSNSKDIAREGAAKANTFIHESPMWSTLLGVGAGFLSGFLVRRSD